MANGYEGISVPAARKLEFNQTMIRLHQGRDATDLLELLASCEIS